MSHLKARQYEVEVLRGLESYAAAELSTVPDVRDVRGLRFWFGGETARLTRLRSAVAVYQVRRFDVPRPKALLGHQQLVQLAEYLAGVAREGGHASFRFSAAGRDSEVFTRLAAELSTLLALPYDANEGELLVRFVRAEDADAWDVLARVTPRPLSARPWRACNRAGGLNATIAHAMLRVGGLSERDRIFNPMCGSGTLLIERAGMMPAEALVGVDIDEEAVDCARENIRAARRDIEVAHVDALATGLPARSFDLILVDLPWGDAIGSHTSNETLYPAFLAEMHRLTSKHGRMVVLTHELRLFERTLADQDRWRGREAFQAYSGGHHPRAYLLSRA
nr:methyltransferase domain-containing protein [Deinococcus maricopensis]